MILVHVLAKEPMKQVVGAKLHAKFVLLATTSNQEGVLGGRRCHLGACGKFVAHDENVRVSRMDGATKGRGCNDRRMLLIVSCELVWMKYGK